MTQITEHVSLAEVSASNTARERGIDNTPKGEHLAAIKALAENIFEPARKHFGKPIRINSGYRSPELNAAIGGSSTSQHCKGEAMDLDATSGFTNADLFYFIRDNLNFDQMIWEKGDDNNPDWVHVSYKASGNNRNECRRYYPNRNPKYPLWRGKESGGSSGNGSSGGDARTGTVTASSLNVRKTPGGDKVGGLANGTKVTIEEEKDGWYKITAGGTKGWVSAEFVKLS